MEYESVYVIIMIDCSGRDPLPGQSGANGDAARLDVVGVYSDFLLASKYMDEVSQLDQGKPNVVYDILTFPLDEEPALLRFLRREKEMRADAIDKHLNNLMKDGLIDQFIGEDGYFYYSLTDLGRKQQTNIPAQIKKFFKKDR